MNRASTHWLLLVLAACSAPPPPPSAPSEPLASAPAGAASDEQADALDATNDTPAPATSATAEPTTAGAALPPVNQAAAKACNKAHGAALERKSPDHEAARLADAAACFERAGALGIAIGIRGSLIQDFADAPEALDALRAMGAGYERAGRLADAAGRYEQYVQRYPKQDDARGLLEHATCVRAGLGDDAGASQNLQLLMRLYGRKHYPAAPTVETLCAQEPSGSP